MGSFLEPFCVHLSPKIDKVSQKLTFEYPHEVPCVDKLAFVETQRDSNLSHTH